MVQYRRTLPAGGLETQHRLSSASSLSLIARRKRLSTIGDRAYPVAVADVWNSMQIAAARHVCTVTVCLLQ